MHSRDANTSFAGTLVDEWARNGVTHAVVAPGSRSTPLALALARDARIELAVVLDERSAAFRALGIGRATGRPAVLLCTSGTAATNFHPAVVEAHHANVPLLVCTADRPPELRDVGAPQTIDQAHLFGTAVRWFHDPGPPDDVAAADAGPQWRALACRAVSLTTAPRPGPVHLNLPFREPLVPTGAPLVDAPGRDDGGPWTAVHPASATVDDATVARVADLAGATERGVIVAGFGARADGATLARLSRATGWPVLADAVSNARTAPGTIASYEALLRVPAFADAHCPDVVLRAGAPLTSKVANAWLAPVPTVLVDGYDHWLDPSRSASHRILAAPGALFAAITDRLSLREPTEWARAWERAERRARDAIDAVLDGDDEPCEARLARDLSAALPDGAHLAVASSLPVRALEWCMAPRDGVTVHANRGANGIDGFVSTVLGIASASEAPTVAFAGDLCFLHDTNGLLTPPPNANATFVVVDNAGGAIFSYLPQHDLPEFDALFATPQSVDVAAVAAAHGVAAERVAHAADVPAALKESVDAGGVRVIVVAVDRDRSLHRHRALWDAVAAALA